MKRALTLLPVLILIASQVAFSDTIDFENFTDGDQITGQIPGLSFSNALVISAGLSLNEIDFPPHSGTNVLVNTDSTLSIDFTDSITSFSGFFTYATNVTIAGFDVLGNQVASITSAFSDNIIGTGGTPNELLSLGFANGFSRVTMTTAGAFFFVVDDISFTPGGATAAPPVPEPSSFVLLATGVSLLVIVLRRRSSLSS